MTSDDLGPASTRPARGARWVEAHATDEGVDLIGRVEGFTDVPLNEQSVGPWLEVSDERARAVTTDLIEKAQADPTHVVSSLEDLGIDPPEPPPHVADMDDGWSDDHEAQARARIASATVEAVADDALLTADGSDDIAVSAAREAVTSARVAPANHGQFRRALTALPAAMTAQRLANLGRSTVETEVEHQRTTREGMAYDARRDYPSVEERDRDLTQHQ